MTTVAELRRRGRAALARSSAATEPREATLLLGRVLDLTEAQLLARPEEAVDDDATERYERLLARRAAGEPVAYLLGEREFFGRTFAVDSRVLIPRPETEHLVEVSLELLVEKPTATVLDVGTGSGCIAITLALEEPRLRVLASDRSLAALAVARHNRRRLAPGRGISLFAADLTRSLAVGVVDLLVSNPPYLAPAEAATMTPDVLDHEPHSSLFAPPDGLSTLNRLLAGARAMHQGALVVLEVGATQARAVAEIAKDAFTLERIAPDYAGRERVVALRRR